MSKKLTLLAAAIAVVAFAAIPAIASAAPTLDFSPTVPTEAKPVKATGTGGKATLNTVGGSTVTCTSSDETVEWTTDTTGHLEVSFTGCSSSGFSCKSSGSAAGTITTNKSLFHLVYINPPSSHTVGILLTPPASGVFAEFECTALVHVKVTGNGIVGHLDSPACGATSASSTISFAQSAAGVQLYQEVEGGATKYHLNSSFNGGTAEQSSEVTTGTTTLPTGETAQLTCL
jgi:hypothetical protein